MLFALLALPLFVALPSPNVHYWLTRLDTASKVERLRRDSLPDP